MATTRTGLFALLAVAVFAATQRQDCACRTAANGWEPGQPTCVEVVLTTLPDYGADGAKMLAASVQASPLPVPRCYDRRLADLYTQALRARIVSRIDMRANTSLLLLPVRKSSSPHDGSDDLPALSI